MANNGDNLQAGYNLYLKLQRDGKPLDKEEMSKLLRHISQTNYEPAYRKKITEMVEAL
jgi:hypothetical protein